MAASVVISIDRGWIYTPTDRTFQRLLLPLSRLCACAPFFLRLKSRRIYMPVSARSPSSPTVFSINRTEKPIKKKEKKKNKQSDPLRSLHLISFPTRIVEIYFFPKSRTLPFEWREPKFSLNFPMRPRRIIHRPSLS